MIRNKFQLWCSIAALQSLNECVTKIKNLSWFLKATRKWIGSWKFGPYWVQKKKFTVQFQYFQYRYFQCGKKIQILISVLYPIFSARHKNLFSKCQKFRVTRCTIPIFSAFSIFSSDIFSPKLLKILELNCNQIQCY